MKTRISLVALAFVALAMPVGALQTYVDTPANWAPDVTCESFTAEQIAESNGVMTETFPTANPDMTVTVHAFCLAGSDDVAASTDCVSKAYSLTGWHWNTPYNAQFDTANPFGLGSSGIISTMNAAGNTWDQAVAADIFGSISAGGSSGNIRRQDFVNQQGFKNLGGGGTIAVTYTWSYSDGRAAESDAAYNTYFVWSLSGEANKMDLQNIATHEMGHTFGMGHTSTASANSCVTMYPYGAYGETLRRTLADGDLLGIDAIY